MAIYQRFKGERWSRQGSNLRPPPCRGDALPAELRDRKEIEIHFLTLYHNILGGGRTDKLTDFTL